MQGMKTMADPAELRRIVDQLCRDDFRSFAIRAFAILEPSLVELAPHIAIICRFLEKIYRGAVRRGLVCMPPRYLKTYLITIAFTAWMLGKNPKFRIICAAYGMPLAEKFNSDTLRLMRSACYKRIFPGTHLNPKLQSKTEFETTAGGYRLATSVGGTITGRGADLIIADDPLKANEAHSPTARQTCIDWFNTSVHTRFNQPKQGRAIVVSQRLHAEDLPGHLLEVGGWEPLILPAINSKKHFTKSFVAGKWSLLRRDEFFNPRATTKATLPSSRRKWESTILRLNLTSARCRLAARRSRNHGSNVMR